MPRCYLYNGQLVSQDELMHWKYIKKVRNSNGRWTYYYDDNREVDTAKQYANSYTRMSVGAYATADARKKNVRYFETKLRESKNRKERDEAIVNLYDAKKSLKVSEKNLARIIKASDSAYKKLKKTKLKHAVIKHVAKGVAAVANVFANTLPVKIKNYY